MVCEVEAPGYGKVRVSMSPHQALQLAIDGEVSAYEFYAEALTKAQDPLVREFLEDLRDEEYKHAEYLRTLVRRFPPGPDFESEDGDPPAALD